MSWIKRFLMHYVLYAALLLVLCFGIFPFVILYTSTMSIAEILDRFSPKNKLAEKFERVWTVIGKPYDYLVRTVG
jgi:hypothetical protein